MDSLEGSGVPVLYIGRTVYKVFNFFFQAAVNRGYWISGYGGTTVLCSFSSWTVGFRVLNSDNILVVPWRVSFRWEWLQCSSPISAQSRLWTGGGGGAHSVAMPASKTISQLATCRGDVCWHSQPHVRSWHAFRCVCLLISDRVSGLSPSVHGVIRPGYEQCQSLSKSPSLSLCLKIELVSHVARTCSAALNEAETRCKEMLCTRI
jgi:hypothetical protein